MTNRRTDAAAAVVADIAARLADPAEVRRRMAGSDRWIPLSLTDGHPATALLHAELAHVDSTHRRIAHAHLAEAATAGETGIHGLYIGPGALAFAAARAARKPSDYAGLLTPLDARLADWARTTLRTEWERIDAGRPGTAFGAYDVVTGVTGVGRHLLDRGDTATVQEILRYLVALTEPVGGLPGWWVTETPTLPAHANAGLAHGIPGPLALLALAWRSGVQVPGQDGAITRIVGWLTDWSGADEHGRYWPDLLTEDDVRARPDSLRPARTAWCYGTPGVATALHLAGTALNPEWTDIAVTATRAMLLRLLDTHGIHDVGLCHGWAGLLTLILRLARDTDARDLMAAADRVAQRVIDGYDPDRLDSVGFLEGAAGTALALHGWLTAPVSGWDAALLAA